MLGKTESMKTGLRWHGDCQDPQQYSPL